jgi:hypothetical protein
MELLDSRRSKRYLRLIRELTLETQENWIEAHRYLDMRISNL